MHVWECVFGLVQGACSLSLLRGHACMCQSVCPGLYQAYACYNCCEVMQACVKCVFGLAQGVCSL